MENIWFGGISIHSKRIKKLKTLIALKKTHEAAIIPPISPKI